MSRIIPWWEGGIQINKHHTDKPALIYCYRSHVILGLRSPRKPAARISAFCSRLLKSTQTSRGQAVHAIPWRDRKLHFKRRHSSSKVFQCHAGRSGAGRTRDVANVTGEEDRLVLANCWGKVGNRRATNPLPAQGGSEENNKVELYRGPVIGIGTL